MTRALYTNQVQPLEPGYITSTLYTVCQELDLRQNAPVLVSCNISQGHVTISRDIPGM